MKVLFVRPRETERIPAETPRYEMPCAGYYPPLGMMSIATCVNEWTEHTASVLDGAITGKGESELTRAIKREHPDVVGLSPVTFTLPGTLRITRFVNEIDPGISVVMGGVHAEQFPHQTVNIEDIDFVVKGDGEIGFLALLEFLEGERELRDSPGLVGLENGRVVEGKPPGYVPELDTLPLIDRTLTPYERYSSVFSERKPGTTVSTSRGCPYGCSFCYLPMRFQKLSYRTRTPGKMVEELRSCAGLGIKEVIFYEDTFTANRKRIMEFCRLMKEEELDITWDMRTRPDCVDRELLQAMKDVGLRRVQLGAESGTQAGLGSVQKGLTLKHSEDAFAMVRELGLDSLGYFMIGLPGETREMIMETIKFSLKLDPDYVNYSLFIPLPGSLFWDSLLKKGDTSVRDVWERFASHPSSDFDVPTYNMLYTKEELMDLQDYAYKTFYLRPKFFLREINRVRSPEMFWLKASTIMKVARSMIVESLGRTPGARSHIACTKEHI